MGQISISPTRFVIDQNRPYVYLQFDHTGTGVKFSHDEPPKRVWFRFVNNCSVSVLLRTFGVPEGSPKDEVGVIHYVVRDREQPGVIHGVRAVEGDEIPTDRKGTELPPAAEIPMGYDFAVSSAESIPPGKSLLFSVPVTHLSKSWHIEIPYEFDLPSGKGPRQPIRGGEPKMVLIYSAWDLPEDVWQHLLQTR